MEPLTCLPEDLTGVWTTLSWSVFRLLINPLVILPPLLLLIGVPWLLPRLRWKRQISGLGAVLLLSYVIASSPTITAIGNKLLVGFLPQDSGARADAIVVLGRGGKFRFGRVEVAADLWRAQRAPLVFASGRGDADKISQMLREKGLPDSAVQGEECSRTTEENARYTVTLLKPRGVHRILLITDPPHMLRSLLTFRSFGFEVIPHTSPMPRRIDRAERAALVFREFCGIVSYGLRGRFAPRSLPHQDVAQQPAALSS